MSPAELAVFHTHPILGQQMLADVPGIDPVVLQAVGQHHERRNGKGFPHRLGSGSINFVTEVIGLSEEVLRQIERSARTSGMNVVKELEKSCADAFSANTFSSVKIFFR